MRLREYWHDITWREKIDAIGHEMHLPRFIQRRLCDWVDRTYYA